MQNHSFRQTYQFLSWHPTIFLASNVARTALAVSTRRGHRRGRLADRPRTTSAADRRRSVDATSPKTEEDNADEYYDDVEEDGETMTNEVATKYAMEENAVYDGEDTDDASTADVETRPSSSSSPLIGGGGGDELCSPVEECELCHRSWRVMIEKEDEKISGEYESCATYGRRRKFECTVLSRGERPWSVDRGFRPVELGTYIALPFVLCSWDIAQSTQPCFACCILSHSLVHSHRDRFFKKNRTKYTRI
jgi:hypothetical protein